LLRSFPFQTSTSSKVTAAATVSGLFCFSADGTATGASQGRGLGRIQVLSVMLASAITLLSAVTS
jgi:hypothetical protein